MMSFKIAHKTLGGHVHVAIWSSEFGVHTTHGKNGDVIFRQVEWEYFRQAMEAYEKSNPAYVVTFVDETPFDEQKARDTATYHILDDHMEGNSR
jgi:hypothetical protein